MTDIPWEQIKIILFQNKLKDIKKITQGTKKKYKSQLQNSGKGERTQKEIEKKEVISGMSTKLKGHK